VADASGLSDKKSEHLISDRGLDFKTLIELGPTSRFDFAGHTSCTFFSVLAHQVRLHGRNLQKGKSTERWRRKAIV
jgi:hypothetical protein